MICIYHKTDNISQVIFFGIDFWKSAVAGVRSYIAGIKSLATAEQAATIATNALSVAINLALNAGAMILITALVQGLTKLVDKLVLTKEELAEVRNEAAQSFAQLKEDSDKLAEEGEAVEELAKKYKEIIKSTSDTADSKDDLSKLQNDLIDKFGNEANKLDLVNGKYEEQIELINKLSDAKYEEWKTENADKILAAEQMTNYNIGWARVNQGGRRVEPVGEYAQTFTNAEIEQVDDLAASLYKVKGVSKDIEEIYKEIEGVDISKGWFSDDLLFTGTLDDVQRQLDDLIARYKEVDGANRNTLQALTTQYNTIKTALNDIDTFYQNIRQYEAETPEVFTLSFDTTKELSQLNAAMGDMRSTWFENLGEMEDGFGKTVDSMISALRTLEKGEGLSSSDFWGVMELDTDKMLTDIQMIGDKFVLNEEQLIKLKDTYIQRQIESLSKEQESLRVKRDELQATIEQAEIELRAIGNRGLFDSAHRQAYQEAAESIEQGKKSLDAYDDELRMTDILMRQWVSKLGVAKSESERIADIQAKITEAQKAADEYAKAMTDAVQSVIDGFENEKQKLEDEKDLLNEHLDILNEKKEAIEETIDQYKSIVDVVQDISDAEIEALEARQEAEEQAVQARIDALKEEKDQKEEETSLDEKQLELRKKLAELDKAKNTKVRTYSAARGWHFDVDREAVAAAQSAADDAQKAYDAAVSNKEYNDEVKALEAEKKAISENYKAQIKLQEDYYKQWSEVVEAQEKAEEEQLAQQILGADYREKIKNRDTTILTKFSANFRSYNSQLNSLVKGEIASLQTSIKAKQNEIDAKNKQIESWKKYKNEVETTINTVKSKYEGYVELLKDVNIEESSSYEQREKALEQFATQFDALTSQVAQYQQRIEPIRLSAVFDDYEARNKMATFIETYRDAVIAMRDALNESATGYGIVNSPFDAKLAEAARYLRGYAQGGTADFTGMTMVHGTKNRAETIFNAEQSKELYNMVRSGSFAEQVANKAYTGLRSAMAKVSTTTNNNTSRNITINEMIIKANNPAEFHTQFMAEISQYWNVKLTESRVK